MLLNVTDTLVATRVMLGICKTIRVMHNLFGSDSNGPVTWLKCKFEKYNHKVLHVFLRRKLTCSKSDGVMLLKTKCLASHTRMNGPS